MEKLDVMDEPLIRELASAFVDKTGEGPYSLLGSPQVQQAFFEGNIRLMSRSGWVYKSGEACLAFHGSSARPPLPVLLSYICNAVRSIGFWKLKAVMLKLSKDQHLPSGPCLQLEMLVVPTAFQGQGWMRRATDELKAISMERGLPVCLETDSAQKAARYQHLGFKLEHARKIDEEKAFYCLSWAAQKR